MSRLDESADIVALAEELGLGSPTKPAEAIVGSCLRRLEGWIIQQELVADIRALEALVIRKLQMVFEEVRSESDFDSITDRYARAKKDPIFATMRMRFEDPDNPTYGALVKRNNTAPDAPDRYVAVIDCRGRKLARRFFTRWHEIAHRMTTHADRGATEPAYRSEHDPIERLMDEIAGRVGFYGPLFEPVFRAAHGGKPLLTFRTVEAVIREGFPDASFQATLNACIRTLPTPVIYLEAGPGYKADLKRSLEDDRPRLLIAEQPEPELRVVRVVANDAAQSQKFLIPWNMQVPESSVIRSLFEADGERDAAAREDLGIWADSRGKFLPGRAVAVEARKAADRVIAIVQPVEPVRPKPQRRQARSWFED